MTRSARSSLAAAATLAALATAALAAPTAALPPDAAEPPKPLGVERSIAPEDPLPRSEISLAVHPRDPRLVAVSAMQFGRPLLRAMVEAPYIAYNKVWVSRDGGASFVGSTLPPLRPATPAGNDATLAWDPRGPLYASYTTFTGDETRSAQEGVYVARTTDAGRTWTRSRLVEGFELRGGRSCGGPDRSTVAVDPRRGWVYVTWVRYADPTCSDGVDDSLTELRWARSVDGGRTFGSPVVVASGGVSNRVAPAVLADGTLVTVHTDASGVQPGQACQFPTRVLSTRWSPTGARLGTTVATTACDNAAGLSPNGAAYTPISFPSASAGPDGRSLLVSLPSFGPDGGGVATGSSADGGRTWTTGFASGTPGSTASMAAVSSGPRGRAAAAWLEVLPAGAYRPVLAASQDGGRTWSAAVPLASVPSMGNARPLSPFDGVAIGHYLGVAVGADGRAHVAWPDLRPDGSPQDADAWVRTSELP